MRPSNFLIIILTLQFSWAVGQTKINSAKNEIVYLCQPCDLPCDTIVYDKPGICPVCKMPLYPSYSWLKGKNHHQNNNMSDKKVAILLFEGVEVIDFAGPFEVFWAAGADVFTVAETTEPLSSGTTLKIIPNFSFDSMPKADIIVLPGGNVDYKNEKIINWIVQSSKESEKVLSVCNGAYFLGASGLLDGLSATTFFPRITGLQTLAPKAKVVDDQRYVNNGKIVTSAGLSSGIDAALFVVSEYIGVGATQQLAVTLEYKWNKDNGFVRAQLADRHFSRATDVFTPFNPLLLSYDGNNTYWEIKTQIETSLAADQLMQLIAAQFEQVQNWKRKKIKSTVGSWTFLDKNQNWIGTVSLEKNAPMEYQYIVTMKVLKKR